MKYFYLSLWNLRTLSEGESKAQPSPLWIWWKIIDRVKEIVGKDKGGELKGMVSLRQEIMAQQEERKKMRKIATEEGGSS